MNTLEKEYYTKLYMLCDQDKDGKISGAEGAQLLKKSGLPQQTLKNIWDLSDNSKRGFLTPREFAIAMRLVSQGQRNQPLSLSTLNTVTALPVFEGIPNPQAATGSLAALSPQEIQKYDELFLQADTNRDGFVDGNEGRTYFSKAQIPTDILAKIWALSDLKRAGKLTRGEFRIAMHLVYWVLQKKPLPNELPATFIQQCIATPSTVAQIPSSGPTLGASMPMTTPMGMSLVSQSFIPAPLTAAAVLISDQNFGTITWKINSSSVNGQAAFTALITADLSNCKWRHDFQNPEGQIETRKGYVQHTNKQKTEIARMIQQFLNVQEDQSVDFNGGFSVPFQADAESYDKKALVWPQLNWTESLTLNNGPRTITFKYNPSLPKETPPAPIKFRNLLKPLKFYVEDLQKYTAPPPSAGKTENGNENNNEQNGNHTTEENNTTNNGHSEPRNEEEEFADFAQEFEKHRITDS